MDPYVRWAPYQNNTNVYNGPHGYYNPPPPLAANTNWNYHPQSQPAYDRFRASKYPNLNPVLAVDTTYVKYDLRSEPLSSIHTSIHQTNAPSPAITKGKWKPGTHGTSAYASEVRIVSKAFPWTLDVRGRPGEVLTVGTIWDALHALLQEPVADSEWGAVLVYDKGKREGILKAAKERIEHERKQGKPGAGAVPLKRIDFLGEHTLFRGLERDETFEEHRLLPGAKAAAEIWVAKMGKV